ncbi:MAG: DUF5020 family protein [Bacteroidales bacterium]|nr:DUF5020 family protein [Bacteroidales bacterium]
MKKAFVLAAAAIFAFASNAKAQTNLQTFYDLSRNHVTTTLEGYYGDKWGDTFFFIDYDFNAKNEKKVNQGVSGSYFEIARGLNFWKESALKDLSAHVEYNGGVGFGNQNFLLGANYLLHNADFSNTFTFELMYKTFNNGASSNCPIQFTFVWGMQDIFGVEGLRFSGFADIWGENVVNFAENGLKQDGFVFISEPQIWYNVGRHFGVDNLSIGGEVEFSVNFAGYHGFKCRPCLGTKWVF